MPVFLLPPGSTLNALIMWCNDHMQVSFRIKFVTGLLGDGHLDLVKVFFLLSTMGFITMKNHHYLGDVSFGTFSIRIQRANSRPWWAECVRLGSEFASLFFAMFASMVLLLQEGVTMNSLRNRLGGFQKSWMLNMLNTCFIPKNPGMS